MSEASDPKSVESGDVEPQHLADLAAAKTPEDRTAAVRQIVDALGASKLNLAGDADRRADLRGVVLAGARLRGAALAFADLRGADCSNTFLAQADLRRAQLEEANFAGADLSHSQGSYAEMDEINLQGALMEEANFEGASFRFADLRDAVAEGSRLAGADFWGARLEKADFSDTSLRDARIGEAFASGADFSRSNLGGANFANTTLEGALFREADLRGANLKGAKFSGADFTQAQLQDLDLSSCDLNNTRWAGARLARTGFSREQLGSAVGEERAGDFEGAARAYVVLERNFRDIGDSDAASWAYRRKRRMQKRVAAKRARTAFGKRNILAAAVQGARFAGDQLVEAICDYGESVARVFGALLVVYFAFLVLYGVTGSVARVDGSVRIITHRPLDLAIFSLMAMTTSGTPSITLVPSNVYALFLSGTQALLGIFLTGLLGFVAGNRIRR